MTGTVLLPLSNSPTTLPVPSHIVASDNAAEHLLNVFDTFRNCSKVVVVCGAGISTEAGIPDFRSSSGLFATLRRDHPQIRMKNGKDLFDSSALRSRHTTAPFSKMIGELAQKAQSASPTPFHHWLRRLDDCGQLLRVYTQNIDCLEMKCGISFGLPTPSLDLKTGKRKTRHHKMLSSNWHLPRCIPLHGRIDFVHCLLCKESYPIAPFTGTFMRGTLPLCPRCELVEELRPFTEKRSRGVGQLRPSVVLYNETHSSGDILGDIITHDLKLIRDRLRSDDIVVLIVVGTSLQISGTKSMVRKFAKILHAPPINRLPNGETKDSSSLTVQSVYLNLDFPSTGRDWEGVFDAWVCGDIQEFSRTMLARYDGE